MTSIINRIRDDENFIEKLKESVNDYFYGKQEVVEVYMEPHTEGSITNTEITSEITFKKEEESFDDLTWKIEIEFNIELSVGCVKSEGDYCTETLTGLCKTDAWVEFPSNTLAIDDIQDIISDIKIEITDCDFERDKKKEEEEFETEYHVYSTWQSAIASMSEEEIIGELIKQEKEIARLKLVVELGETKKRLLEMLSKRENNALPPE